MLGEGRSRPGSDPAVWRQGTCRFETYHLVLLSLAEEEEKPGGLVLSHKQEMVLPGRAGLVGQGPEKPTAPYSSPSREAWAGKPEGNMQISREILTVSPGISHPGRACQSQSWREPGKHWGPCGQILPFRALGCGSQRLNANYQAQWQVPLPGETSHLPVSLVGML